MSSTSTPKTIKITSEGIPLQQALSLVSYVVGEGRISETRNGPSFCFCTRFQSKESGDVSVIFANRTKTQDVFTVMRELPTDTTNGTNS